ncbi:MAG: hypothetical protein JWL59_4842 [Chthoniobacteraceae bacterium]|nr:hypothetical protein [Chthoniobacteraceae bacterium]
MKITRLRGRSHSAEEERDPLVEDLLEVLLCGLGAAAALMMLYSVLPKSGSPESPGGAKAERAATRREAHARRPPKAVSGSNDFLIQIWVEAGKGTGIEPGRIELHGLDAKQRLHHWTEGREDTGWRRVFVTHAPADNLKKLELICAAGSASKLAEKVELTLEIGIDSDFHRVKATYDPPAPVNHRYETAGVFLLEAQEQTPAIPQKQREATPPSREERVLIATIHPADPERPVRGITPK